jgi:type III pantothenate kinase
MLFSAQIMHNRWIALIVGNSRLHWALFAERQQLQVWHSPLSEFKGFQQRSFQDWAEWQPFFPPFRSAPLGNDLYSPYPELWLASVVPSQSEFWSTYPNLHLLQLSDVPLRQIYAGLGLDRAIALWGAGTTYGWPCLAIDGGTALTLTGADASASLVGGAILPGLRLQFQALASSTAALGLIELPQELPTLWGKDTATAIQSGVVNTAIAGIRHAMQQWTKTYPDSKIVVTGGDAEPLSLYIKRWVLQYEEPGQELNCLITDPTVIFTGMQALRRERLNKP